MRSMLLPVATVVTVTPDMTVRDLVAMLAEHRIGATVVSADGGTVDGIVSERDVVRALADRITSPSSVSPATWTNQNGRWGSCTPADRTIRISHRIQEMPDWVIDYVLLHELAHLVVPSHNARFWELVGRYPKTERARGYLEGVAASAGKPGSSRKSAP